MTLREELQRKTTQALLDKLVEKDLHLRILEEHFTAICNKAAECGKLEAYFWYGLEGGLPDGEFYTSFELKSFAIEHNLDYTPSEYNSPAILSWKSNA